MTKYEDLVLKRSTQEIHLARQALVEKLENPKYNYGSYHREKSLQILRMLNDEYNIAADYELRKTL